MEPWYNPGGTPVEPRWNPCATLPQGRPGPPRSLSGKIKPIPAPVHYSIFSALCFPFAVQPPSSPELASFLFLQPWAWLPVSPCPLLWGLVGRVDVRLPSPCIENKRWFEFSKLGISLWHDLIWRSHQSKSECHQSKPKGCRVAHLAICPVAALAPQPWCKALLLCFTSGYRGSLEGRTKWKWMARWVGSHK